MVPFTHMVGLASHLTLSENALIHTYREVPHHLLVNSKASQVDSED